MRADTRVAQRDPGVRVDDRVPHRVHREGGGHLEVGGLLEFARSAVRIGQRLGPQDRCRRGCRAGRTAASCGAARNRATPVPQRPSRPPRRTGTQDIDPAALQEDAVDVQWLPHLAPVPLGVAESLVGVVELRPATCGSARGTASTAKRRVPGSLRLSRDRPRGPGSGSARSSPVAHAAVPRSNCVLALANSQPRASARAPARRSQGSASDSRPVSMQNRPYPVAPWTSRWSSDSQP